MPELSYTNRLIQEFESLMNSNEGYEAQGTAKAGLRIITWAKELAEKGVTGEWVFSFAELDVGSTWFEPNNRIPTCMSLFFWNILATGEGHLPFFTRQSDNFISIVSLRRDIDV